MSAEIKIINFHSGSVREFSNFSRPEMRLRSSQSRMPVLSRDREEDFPEWSGREKTGSREMAFRNADLYHLSNNSCRLRWLSKPMALASSLKILYELNPFVFNCVCNDPCVLLSWLVVRIKWDFDTIEVVILLLYKMALRQHLWMPPKHIKCSNVFGFFIRKLFHCKASLH